MAKRTNEELQNAVAEWEMQQNPITPRQARLALLNAGLLSQVATAIASLDSPAKEVAEVEWEYATSIERGSEWINQLGAALGLDAAGIDALFKQAAEL